MSSIQLHSAPGSGHLWRWKWARFQRARPPCETGLTPSRRSRRLTGTGSQPHPTSPHHRPPAHAHGGGHRQQQDEGGTGQGGAVPAFVHEAAEDHG